MCLIRALIFPELIKEKKKKSREWMPIGSDNIFLEWKLLLQYILVNIHLC